MISMNFLKEIYLRKDLMTGPSLFPITFYNKAFVGRMGKILTMTIFMLSGEHCSI